MKKCKYKLDFCHFCDLTILNLELHLISCENV